MKTKELLSWISGESKYMNELGTFEFRKNDYENEYELNEFMTHMFGGVPKEQYKDGYYVYLYTRNEDKDFCTIGDNKPTFTIELEQDTICFFIIEDIKLLG